MYDREDDAVLNSRIQATKEAQTRSRVAFFILTYATGAILAGLWNQYLSWERQWPFTASEPKNWGESQLIAQQIKSWVESQAVGISLLGLRVSVSDVAVLGSAALLVLAYYQCLCLRRENHEIGTLLRDTKAAPAAVQHLVFAGIRSSMIFNTTSSNDAPFGSLEGESAPPKTIALFRRTSDFLVYFPALVIALIVASDVYFAIWYRSPWRNNPGPAWLQLNEALKIQLVATDVFAVVAGITVFYFCQLSAGYHKATRMITQEYLAVLNQETSDSPKEA
jgi:hypothetical protein